MKKGLLIVMAVVITYVVVKQGLKYVVERNEELSEAEVAFLKARKQAPVGTLLTTDEVEQALFPEVPHA